MISTNYAHNCDSLTQYINKMSNSEINGNCADVYIGSNEEDRQETFNSLANSLPTTTSCHIGFSSWFNFDIIFKRKSSRAVLIDFNPRTKAFLQETLNLVMTSGDRNEFAGRISQHIAKDKYNYSPNVSEEVEYSYQPEEEVFVEQTIPNNWLNSDEGFNYIKTLAKEGKIAIITENICSDEKMKRISSVIKENGYFVDTLYVSNIAKYMTTETDRNFYIRSINHLSGSKTKIIHVPSERYSSDLKQKVLEVDKIQHAGTDGDLKIGLDLMFPHLRVASLHRPIEKQGSSMATNNPVPALDSNPSLEISPDSRNEGACPFRAVAFLMVAGVVLYLSINR